MCCPDVRVCCDVLSAACHVQAHINSPEALATAAAAAAAAAAEANVAPLHEENEWGIEVCDEAATDTAAAAAAGSSGNARTGEALPEGLTFAMPTAGVDAAVLQEEAVKPTDASLDELTSMLSSLNK
jgi:hypothetical protein